MSEKVTIRRYLKDEEFANKNEILINLFLGNIPIDLLFSVFEDRIKDKTPASVADFISDENNSYELAMFGSRFNNKNRIEAYNGKNFYYGTNGKSTLGASHSRYSSNSKSWRK